MLHCHVKSQDSHSKVSTCMFLKCLGEFGIVYKSHYVKGRNTEVVAVKTLKGLLIM